MRIHPTQAPIDIAVTWDQTGKPGQLPVSGSFYQAGLGGFMLDGTPLGGVRWSSETAGVPGYWTATNFVPLPFTGDGGAAITGNASLIFGQVWDFLPDDTINHATIWDASGEHRISGLGGIKSFAWAINPTGTYLGITIDTSNPNDFTFGCFIGRDGWAIRPNFPGFAETRAFEINDSGWFTGVWEPAFATQRGYVAHYDLDTNDYEIHDLGIFPGYGETWAYAINNDRTIVGGAQPLGGDFQKALIWRNGSLVPEDLNTMVSIPGATLIDAYRINNAGQILAEARLHAGGYAYYRLDPIQEWTHNGDGAWGDTANWFGPVPDALQHSANFKGAITAPATITSDSPHRVGTITFDSAHGYTLTGPGTITLDDYHAGRIDVLNGSHVIDAPLALTGNITVNTAGATGVRLDDLHPAADTELTKTGGGTLAINALRARHVWVDAGRLSILEGGAAGRVESMAIAGAIGAWTATFDIADSRLVVDYKDESPLATITDQIKSGFAGGSWNGTGINSSVAASTPNRALGFAEATDIGSPAVFAGQAIDATSVLLAFTMLGDSNLDLAVNIADFSLLAANFNLPGEWVAGDFNYDGVTNIGDFALLAANFNLALPADLPRGSAIPEPAGSALLLLAAMRRRRGE